MRDELLPRARFADQQHGTVGRRHQFDLFQNRLPCRTLTDVGRKGLHVTHGVAQMHDFLSQLTALLQQTPQAAAVLFDVLNQARVVDRDRCLRADALETR
jgi:hypothetical protein